MAKARAAGKGQVPPAPEPPPTEFDAATGIRSTVLHFDEDGYPGWWAKVRVNPKTRDWEAFLTKKPAGVWEALGSVVLDWNFVDGEPLPLPGKGLEMADLHRDLAMPLIVKYINAVFAVAAAPKG